MTHHAHHHHHRHRHIGTPGVASMRNDSFINGLYKNPPSLDASKHHKKAVDFKKKYQNEMDKLNAKHNTKKQLLMGHQKEQRSHLAQKQLEKRDRLAQDELLHNQQQKARLDRKQVHAQAKMMQSHENKQQKQVQELKASQLAERQHLQEKQAKQVGELKGRQEREQLQFKHQQEAQFRKQQRQQLELHQRQDQKGQKLLHDLQTRQRGKREELLSHQLSERRHQDEKQEHATSHLRHKFQKHHPELFVDPQQAQGQASGSAAQAPGPTLFGRLTGWWGSGGNPQVVVQQVASQNLGTTPAPPSQVPSQAVQSSGVLHSAITPAPPPLQAGPLGPTADLTPHAEGGQPISGLRTVAQALVPKSGAIQSL